MRADDFRDDLGPDKVLLVHDPHTGMQGFVVVDNVACGPSIGGVRMAADVTPKEVFRLARTMTLKSAAVGLPHGGGKAGIVSPPNIALEQKERLLRSFARAIRCLDDYIPGPDMGTDEAAMAVIKDEIGRAVGLPRVVGGIPLDEIGATGFGLAVSAHVAQEFVDFALRGARVVIQGFGNVGRHAALKLAEMGASIVAVADSAGAVENQDGLDLAALTAHKSSGASVGTFPGGKSISIEELISVASEIWVPAARPDVIHVGNAHQMNTRLLLCGANLPIAEGAEELVREKGIIVVPDFIANAGGLICAAVEYRGGTESQALAAIEELIGTNTQAVLRRSRDSGRSTRQEALDLATTRVRQAMRFQRK